MQYVPTAPIYYLAKPNQASHGSAVDFYLENLHCQARCITEASSWSSGSNELVKAGVQGYAGNNFQQNFGAFLHTPGASPQLFFCIP